MKKLIIAVLLTVAYCTISAQQKGIKFEKNTTWEKVLDKAKAENKYIFIDCFTTWCGPCEKMSEEVFPQRKVGDFYNKNFINIKLQFDSTDKDDLETISWRYFASLISKKTPIFLYPTYLILNSNGDLLDKFVGGTNANLFINNAKLIISKKEPYFILKKQFETNKNSTFLYNLALESFKKYDMPFTFEVANEYVNHLNNNDIFTKKNLKFLTSQTNSYNNGFKVLLTQAAKADSILGNKETNYYLKNIITNEEIRPILDQKNTLNWDSIENVVSIKYPTIAQEYILESKINQAASNSNWNLFEEYLFKYNPKFSLKEFDLNLLKMADNTFIKITNETLLRKTANWCKMAIALKSNDEYFKTYANLLYKLGRANEAIKNLEKAIVKTNKSKGREVEYKKQLDKMKNGLPTW